MSSYSVRLALISAGIMWVGATATRAAPGDDARTVIFIWDRISFSDLATSISDLPHLSRLADAGAVGAVNIFGAKGRGTRRAAITLNAGAKADAESSAGEMFNAWEEPLAEPAPAHEVYERRTGLKSPGRAAIVNPYLGEVLTANEIAFGSHAIHVGALGDAVHAAGGLSAALGCADAGFAEEYGTRSRSAALVAMDSSGLVDLGDVSRRTLMHDRRAPYGARADTRKMVAQFTVLMRDPRVRLLVIEFGDTYRADAYGLAATPAHAVRLKTTALRRADNLLAAIVQRLNPQRDLLVVLPLSLPKSGDGELAPAVMWGEGIAAGSYLTSGTTKREGFITLSDVTATIFARLTTDRPAYLLGRPIAVSGQSLRCDQRVNHLLLVNRATALTDQYLRPLCFAIIGLWQAIAMLLCATCLLWMRFAECPLRRPAATVMKFLLFIPTVIYLINAAALEWVGGSKEAALLTVVGGFIGWEVASRFVARNTLQRHHGSRCLIATVLVWLALALASRFRSEFNAIFGYSSYFGGRYYGIGGVTMAVLLGTTLTLIGWSTRGNMNKLALTWVGLVSATLTIFLALPGLGAKFGGCVGAMFTLTPTWLKLAGISIKIRHIVTTTFALLLFVAILATLDLRHPPAERSHLGRWAATMQEEGIAPVGYMIVDKARVWGHSFGHWYWDVCLGAMVLSCFMVFGACRDQVKALLTARPPLNATLQGGLIGGLVSFLLNDSGPAVPCLMGLFLLGPVFCAMLDRESWQ